MMFRVSSRRMMSTTASTLSALGELLPDEAKQDLTGLRAMHAEIMKMKATYGNDPAPIDFAAYKTKMDPEVVKQVEESYNAMVYPSTAEFEATSPEAKASMKKHLEDIDAAIKETEDVIVDLKSKMAALEAKKTTIDTTAQDYLDRFPELEDEIDKEIHNHEWAKDIAGKSS